MEIILTYRGKIPSNRKDLGVIWDMRKAFHVQLAKLWGKEPFSVLKEWEDSGFAAGAPDFRKCVGKQQFVPFYGRQVGIGVELDISLLSGIHERQSVISAGDLDNRIKRIVDGLRAPTQTGEILEGLDPDGRWYCLMEDDSSVMKIDAKLGTFLASDDPSESFAFIRVRTVALKVTFDNLELLM